MDVTASYTTSLLDFSQQVVSVEEWSATYITQAILDGFAGDLLISMSQESSLQSFSSIFSVGVCPTDDQGKPFTGEHCFDHPSYIMPEIAMFTYADRSILAYTTNPTIPETLNASVSNYLQFFSAAALYDTGIWRNNSILTSPNFVNATLHPNDAVSSAVASNFTSLQGYYPLLWPNNCAAQVWMHLFGDLYPLTPSPAVIAMTYTCHIQQLKAPLNFVVCMFS